MWQSKGGLISESFFTLAKCAKDNSKDLQVDRARDSDLAHFLGDWNLK